jgi:hypothetical protein
MKFLVIILLIGTACSAPIESPRLQHSTTVQSTLPTTKASHSSSFGNIWTNSIAFRFGTYVLAFVMVAMLFNTLCKTKKKTKPAAATTIVNKMKAQATKTEGQREEAPPAYPALT